MQSEIAAEERLNSVTAPSALYQPHVIATVSKEVLQQKLKKAISLADEPANDKYFDIQRTEDYFTKDAMDNKHGFYYLRVGSDNDQYDLSLKVKMFLRGNQVETTEQD